MATIREGVRYVTVAKQSLYTLVECLLCIKIYAYVQELCIVEQVLKQAHTQTDTRQRTFLN